MSKNLANKTLKITPEGLIGSERNARDGLST
jgi:hypothetical protein